MKLHHSNQVDFHLGSVVKAFAWGLSKTIKSTISLAAIYDRDYFCQEFLDDMSSQLSQELDMSHIHDRKEIENYMLSIPVLNRLLEKQISIREQRTGEIIPRTLKIEDFLDQITSEDRSEIQSQYISKRQKFLDKNGKDPATVTKETIAWFDNIWNNFEKRLTIVHGKRTIRLLRDAVQKTYSVNMTDFQIIDSFNKEEVAADLVSLINKLEGFQNS